MPNLFYEIWENLVARTRGPLNFRFVLFPVLAVLFALRAAMRDVKKQRPPYLWRLLSTWKERRAVIQEGRRDLGNLFVFAMLLDILYQVVVVYILQGTEIFYPLESIFVALILTILPYVLIRGPANRLIRKIYAKKKPNDHSREKSHHTF